MLVLALHFTTWPSQPQVYFSNITSISVRSSILNPSGSTSQSLHLLSYSYHSETVLNRGCHFELGTM